jgi:hypothetical protein
VPTTLRELRQLAGIKTGDVLLLKATATSSSTSTFEDRVHLGDRGDDSTTLLNRLLYFSQIKTGNTSGANVGHSSVVSDYASSTRILGYTPDSPVPPELGDTAELWTVSERVGSMEQIKLLINHSIASVAEQAAEEVYADDYTFDARTGRITIPASWAGGEFGGADWVERDGYVREISPRWLRVSPGSMTVTLWGRGSDRAHRRTVRLYGYPPVGPLENDDDATIVDRDWIVESVASALTLGPSWRSGDAAAAERRANFWATQASGYRRNVSGARRGLGISLPQSTG